MSQKDGPAKVLGEEACVLHFADTNESKAEGSAFDPLLGGIICFGGGIFDFATNQREVRRNVE